MTISYRVGFHERQMLCTRQYGAVLVNADSTISYTKGMTVAAHNYKNERAETSPSASKTSRVNFIPKQIGLDLWDFGEDAYIDRALSLSDEELIHLGERTYANFNAEFYERVGKTLPAGGYDIGFVSAATLVEYFEGQARPLRRNRRRNHAELPEKLVITIEDYLGHDKNQGVLHRLKKLLSKWIKM